ncbi:MAG: 3-isopropylmalate dehydratase small subunit [Candidatus Dadabacteria bacterium]|nr:3-isopropylmalate dehydratase small subunit [Candidatus Dadabacteria bacterium]NIS07245.1 3-isopropylmalate dehydratase small subunit [Candidatus Dadabacteria bacterium]NIV40952.1 3-isopropylmalate dehydratase small subunit [Candidatus Dadabacteria bacterium]NIX14384.1 3-isopropylmalate dehydratase small subunit [Candidatus Dadabacteria bacterium]NIY20902.1 3-isopropylmalate dehydratase small subunit [Candidatus Dadabacteria bacterium]
MKPFENFKGIVAPLDKMNVDTDQIIPKQFLKRIERTGFGEFLFYDWRYLDDGKPNPEFILNRDGYKNSRILLAKDNFGSGSSREHAPWSLEDYGFKVIIAPSFADIFYNNCFKNGMLPIVLPADMVDYLFEKAFASNGYMLEVNLNDQVIKDDSGWSAKFEIDKFKKKTLLEGLDDIALTLQLKDHISAFEQDYNI